MNIFNIHMKYMKKVLPNYNALTVYIPFMHLKNVCITR